MTPTLLFIAITSTACPPCAALHRDYGSDERFQFVDATPEVREQYRVRAVPVVVAMRDGREVARHVGYEGRREMERWIRGVEATQEKQNEPEQAQRQPE